MPYEDKRVSSKLAHNLQCKLQQLKSVDSKLEALKRWPNPCCDCVRCRQEIRDCDCTDCKKRLPDQ